MITEILPSLDNLERALQVESTNEEVQTVLKGCTNGIRKDYKQRLNQKVLS